MAERTGKMKMKDLFSMKGKNIIGVNPPVQDFAFFDLWSKPLGLLYLLEKMRLNGNCVSLIDCIHEGAEGQKIFGREKIAKLEIEKPPIYKNIKRKYHQFGLCEQRIKTRLREMPKPDAVFLTSGMTYWYGGVKWMIDILHSELPKVPVILGGIYARLCPEHAAGLGADFIVTENWTPDVEHPAMDLYGRPPYGVTMTSFGCPFACSYCASHILWPDYIRRPLSEVIAEIDFQVQLGAADFAFYDDALLLNKEEYFYPLCREIVSLYGGKLRLHTPNGLHVREIDAGCACILRNSGFRTIRLSLESIDPGIATASSGKIARGEYSAAVKHLKSVGYSREECETYILLGLPGQSLESVKETINFVHAAGGKPKLAEFSPIPGTPFFYEAAEKIPRLLTEPLLHNNSVYSSWISGEIIPEQLQELKNLARLSPEASN